MASPEERLSLEQPGSKNWSFRLAYVDINLAPSIHILPKESTSCLLLTCFILDDSSLHPAVMLTHSWVLFHQIHAITITQHLIAIHHMHISSSLQKNQQWHNRTILNTMPSKYHGLASCNYSLTHSAHSIEFRKLIGYPNSFGPETYVIL